MPYRDRDHKRKWDRERMARLRRAARPEEEEPIVWVLVKGIWKQVK